MKQPDLPVELRLTRPNRRRSKKRIAAAEFFAGVGLVRLGLEQADIDVVFATDIDGLKYKSYEANFGAGDFHLTDVRKLTGDEIPDIEVATASFPCTDLSLAGKRAGLKGIHSSMFWEFARIMDEMGERKPSVLLLENVPGFASSREGKDLHDALKRLNQLGYFCDLLVVDAKHFVPQSRQRLFIVATEGGPKSVGNWEPSSVRPAWIEQFVERFPKLKMLPAALPEIEPSEVSLSDVAERMNAKNPAWWDEERTSEFVDSLSPLQRARLEKRRGSRRLSWATAYRRTRNGSAVWEIRSDDIAGCLRTPRGGSSKQAVVETGRGRVRVRWMTALEYARLQGAPDFKLHAVTETQAKFAMGDAVCVPAVAWIMREYTSLLAPLPTPRKRASGRR